MSSRIAPSRGVRHYQVAAGILWDGSQVLIARRNDNDHQGGRWEFPGGKLHAGETVQQCLRREMMEEVALDVDVGPLWRALTHVYPDRRVSIYFHLCFGHRGTPRALECAEVRWVPPSGLAGLTFVEGDVLVLPDLIRELGRRAV